MLYQSTLPSRPLTRTDMQRLRSHPDVRSLIALGSGSLYSHEADRHPSVSQAIVLSDRDALKIWYDGTGWSTEVLKTKASETDLLPLALNELDQD